MSLRCLMHVVIMLVLPSWSHPKNLSVVCNRLCSSSITSETSTVCNITSPFSPWRGKDVESMSKPLFTDAYYYIHQTQDGRKMLALNITWVDKGAHVGDGRHLGYQLVISAGGSASHTFQFDFVHAGNRNSMRHYNYIFTNFPCYGQTEDTMILDMGRPYVLLLKALPSSNDEGVTHQKTYRIIDVPGCDEQKELRETVNCEEEPRPEPPATSAEVTTVKEPPATSAEVTTVKDPRREQTKFRVTIGSAASIALIVMMIIFLLRKRLQLPRTLSVNTKIYVVLKHHNFWVNDETPRVLLLVRSEETFLKNSHVQQLVKDLSERLVFNLRHQIPINENAGWTRSQLLTANVVIFVPPFGEARHEDGRLEVVGDERLLAGSPTALEASYDCAKRAFAETFAEIEQSAHRCDVVVTLGRICDATTHGWVYGESGTAWSTGRAATLFIPCERARLVRLLSAEVSGCRLCT